MTEQHTSVLFDTGDLSAPVGSGAWVRAVHLEAKAAIHDTDVAYQNLEVWIGGLREDDRYQQLSDESGRPFRTWHQFCSTRQPFGLGYSPEALAALLHDRKEAQTAKERAADAEPITHQGRPGKGSVSTFSDGKRDADYLTRRIARDRPDILDRMKAGEFSSVRAAAREAGLVRPTAQIYTDDVESAASALRRHFQGDRLRELRDALEEEG